jgi:hypothetical protein
MKNRFLVSVFIIETMKRIKNILLLNLLLMLSCTTFSQKQIFDVLSYTQQAGWEKSESAGSVIFSRYKGNDFCMITFYKSIIAGNDPQKNFNLSWQSLIKKILGAGEPTMQPDNKENGWNIKTGSASFDKDGTKGIAMLIAGTAGNRLVNIVYLFNTDAFQKEAEHFLATVELQKQKAETAATAPVVSSSKNIKYEVWECNCPNLATNTQVTTKLNTVVLSPDGKCLYHMPEKGLNGVTPASSNQEGSWGNVTDKGNMLSLVNDKYGKMDLYKITSTSMSMYPNKTSSVYKKVKQADGLRFEGAYSPELSYYNGKTDIISRQINPNKRPIIFFKKDGTYINEGIEFSNLTFGDDYAIGKGTYEIINYSLILTTQSGRKLQTAFTPILDANPAAIDNGGFIINNLLFYKLGKDFVPHN